jgi:Ca2+-binding RTX toxin-like protein
MRVRGLVGIAFALAVLTAPGAAVADHVSIHATVTATVKERYSSQSWRVEVRWAAQCLGATGSASYSGNLYLMNTVTDESEYYLGGVFSDSGTVSQLVSAKAKEYFLRPELHIGCAEDSSLHGASTIAFGGAVRIPGSRDDGEGGSGGGGGGGGGSGGGGGRGPTDPVGSSGCKYVLQGTDRPDTLAGGGRGEVVFGYGAGDRLRGGAGNDCLLGGKGADQLRGEAGSDRLTGGSGNDVLIGGSGVNVYDAGRGNDVVHAVNGRRETVRCGPGRDLARVDRRDRVIGCERVKRSR